MISYIIGSLFIIFGLIFIFKPMLLKQKIINKSTKKIKKYLFLISLIVGILLISSAWEYHGLIAIIISILGVISIFKAFLFLKSNITEKVVTVIEKQGALFFRIYALIMIALGVLIIFGLHHSTKVFVY